MCAPAQSYFILRLRVSSRSLSKNVILSSRARVDVMLVESRADCGEILCADKIERALFLEVCLRFEKRGIVNRGRRLL